MNDDATPANTASAAVNPQFVFGMSLFFGLALSWSALSGAMSGSVDIVSAGTHLLIAVAFSWAGGYGLCSLLTSFANASAVRRASAADISLPRDERSLPSAAIGALPAAPTTPTDSFDV